MIHGTTTRARATALEGPFKEELVRLQVRRAIARACTAKCVCRHRRRRAGPLLRFELFQNPRCLGYSEPRCIPAFRNSFVRSFETSYLFIFLRWKRSGPISWPPCLSNLNLFVWKHIEILFDDVFISTICELKD